MIDLWHGALSWWKSTLPSSFVVIFSRFLPSNTTIIRYNISYLWFFLSQGNRWTKYLAHPKIQRPKPCLLMFVSLVALDGFHLLMSTQLTADLIDWIKVGDPCFIHGHIFMQKLLFVALKHLQTTLLIVDIVFNWLWANVASTLNTTFLLTNVHVDWWIHCFLISHTTSIYNRPKQVKVSIPPLNHCFWRSRVGITLIKPLLCLNSIFSHQKAILYRHTKFRFFSLFWKFATIASLK